MKQSFHCIKIESSRLPSIQKATLEWCHGSAFSWGFHNRPLATVLVYRRSQRKHTRLFCIQLLFFSFSLLDPSSFLPLLLFPFFLNYFIPFAPFFFSILQKAQTRRLCDNQMYQNNRERNSQTHTHARAARALIVDIPSCSNWLPPFLLSFE